MIDYKPARMPKGLNMRPSGFLAIAALIALPGIAQAGNSLIAKGVRVTVAKSAMTVVPDREWNKMGARPGRNSETWTLDGPQLNDLAFYGGIESGMPLFKDRDRKNHPLPRFAASMLPTDITQLFESSYRVAIGTSLMSIDSVEPAPFAGAKGVRFTYHFVVQGEEVKRQGIGTAAIIGGKLYMITFEAPILHYFNAGLPYYRSIADSVTLDRAG